MTALLPSNCRVSPLPPAGLALDAFRAAREQIEDHVLTTPLVRAVPGVVPSGRGDVKRGMADVPVGDGCLDRDLLLKLESLQVSGSFKARGALNKVLSLRPEIARRGIVTASGGNHGLAVAYAGRVVDVPTTVYLPTHTSAVKAARIEGWGATVVRAGIVWDDAHAAALEHATRDGLTYVHPFADLAVIAGLGTIALEIFEQAPEVDLFLHALLMLENDGANDGPVPSDAHVAQHLRVPARRHPVSRTLALSVVRHRGVLLEANRIRPADRVEVREQPLIAESTVGKHHDVDALSQDFVQPVDDRKLPLASAPDWRDD